MINRVLATTVRISSAKPIGPALESRAFPKPRARTDRTRSRGQCKRNATSRSDITPLTTHCGPVVSPNATLRRATSMDAVHKQYQIGHMLSKLPMQKRDTMLRGTDNPTPCNSPPALAKSTTRTKFLRSLAQYRPKPPALTRWQSGQDARPRQSASKPWAPREGHVGNCATLKFTYMSYHTMGIHDLSLIHI